MSLRAVLLFVLVLGTTNGLMSQSYGTPYLYPLSIGSDGTINVVKKNGKFLFLGGQFNTIGRSTGNYAILDKYGKVRSFFNNFTLNGGSCVYKSGFIVSAYSYNENYINRLTYIDSNGIKFKWNTNLTFYNGGISKILPVGDDIFVAGSYTHIGNDASCAQRFNARSFPQKISFPSIDGSVKVIESDGKGGWFLGGHFNMVNDISRANFVYVYADGTISNLDFKVSGDVVGIKKIDSLLFVSGVFGNVGDSVRNGLFIYDLKNNKLLPFKNASGTIYTMDVKDSILFTGGSISTVENNGKLESRYNLACYNWITGKIIKWIPVTNAGVVSKIKLLDTVLLVSGSFSNSGSDHKGNGYLTAFSIKSALPISYLDKVNGTVSDFTINDSAIYFCGDFTSVGANARNGVCVYNFLRNKYHSFNTGSHIYPFKTINIIEDTVLLGGSQYLVGSDTCRNFSAYYLSTNNLIKAKNIIFDGPIYCSYQFGNDIVYGGAFALSNPVYQPYLIKFNAKTGITSNVSYKLNGQINLLYERNGILYIAGNFSSILGSARSGLAAIDIATNKLQNWNPIVDGSEVNDICLTPQSVFIGGYFTTVNSVNRNGLAEVDYTNGANTSFYAPINGVVSTLAYKDSNLFVGGNFSSIGSPAKSIRNFAIVNRISYKISNVDLKIDNNVNKIAVSDDIIVGGNFNYSGNLYVPKLLKVNINTLLVDSKWHSVPNGEVGNILTSGDRIFISGSFSMCDILPRKNLCAFNIEADSFVNWNPAPDNTVNDMEVRDTILYIGGAFAKVGSQNLYNLAKVSTQSGKILNGFNPNFPSANVVNRLKLKDTLLYVSASNSIQSGTVTEPPIASFSANNGKITSWNPDKSITRVRDFILKDTFIYALGDYSYSGNYYNILGIGNQSGKVVKSIREQSMAVNDIVNDSNWIICGGGANVPDSMGQPMYRQVDFGLSKSKRVGSKGYNINKLVYDDSLIYSIGLFRNGKVDNQYEYAFRYDPLRQQGPFWLLHSYSSYGYSGLEFSDTSIYVNGMYTDMFGITRNGFAEVGKQAFTTIFPSNNNFCPGDSIAVQLQSDIKYNSGNAFKADFQRNGTIIYGINPLLYSSTGGKLSFKIPDTLSPGNYTLRVSSTSPFSYSPVYPIRVIKNLPVHIYTRDTEQCIVGNLFEFETQESEFKRAMWRVDDDSIAKTSILAYRFPKSGKHLVELTTFGCKGFSYRDTAYAAVFEEPKLQLWVNDSTQCLTGNKFQFKNKTIDSVIVGKYYWNNNLLPSLKKDTTIVFPTTGRRTLILTGYFGQKCLEKLSMRLEVYSRPKAAMTLTDSVYCLSEEFFKPWNGTSQQYGPVAFTWYFDSIYKAATPKILLHKGGVYYCKLVASSDSGCSDSAIKRVIVVDSSINLIHGYVNVIGDSLYEYYLDSTYIKSASWSVSNGTIVGGSNFKKFIKWKKGVLNGNIDIAIVSLKGCISDTAKLSVNIAMNGLVNIEKHKAIFKVTPLGAGLYRFTNNQVNGTNSIKLVIFDQKGSIVKEYGIKPESVVDMNDLSPGIYLCRIIGDGINETLRIVVEN